MACLPGKAFISALVLTAALLTGTEPAQSMTFVPVGRAEGATSVGANAVSADGLAVVGNGKTAEGFYSWHWTAAMGTRILPQLPNHRPSSFPGLVTTDALAVAGRGDTAVGYGYDENGEDVALRWDLSRSEMVVSPLPTLGFRRARAKAISSDGRTMAGWIRTASGLEASVWNESASIVGDLPGGNVLGGFNAVSANGTLFVGAGSVGTGIHGTVRYNPVIWNGAGALRSLGLLPTYTSGEALDISADGSTVVGYMSEDGQREEAFFWTEPTGLQALGSLIEGSSYARARGVSDDGALIVGDAIGQNGATAWVWTQRTGMVELHDYATGLGLDLSGYLLTNAYDVSADGQTIVGHARGPEGSTGFVMHLPEPASALLWCILLAVLRVRRGMKRDVPA